LQVDGHTDTMGVESLNGLGASAGDVPSLVIHMKPPVSTRMLRVVREIIPEVSRRQI
jgi:hypothetical protein